MTTLRIGGVPEHFNYPIHLAIQNGAFKNQGIHIKWTDFPGGTGAMNKALRENVIDVAIVLTEGIVKDIANGNRSKIIQTYVQSPLLWGIHVGAESNFRKEEDLKGKRIAISRFGSGSHLMAHVHADTMGWNLKEDQFVVVNNIDGAVEALTKGTADYFMWEHFTTKPIVDDGTFRRVGDFPTPWPCFVLAARQEVIKTENKGLEEFLKILNSTTSTFKNIRKINAKLSEKYEQRSSDIDEWLLSTQWSQSQLTTRDLDNVQQILKELKHIDKCYPDATYLTDF
ncbi:MAG: substrate-binding domain-containing protein [Leeuwenhoekiella sp.]